MGPYETESDESLVGRVVQGDQHAFEIIYTRHKHSMFNYVYHMTGQRQLAEDCVQDIFIHLYKKAGLFNPKFRFTAWLFQMAKHIAFDALRKNRVRRAFSLEAPLVSGGEASSLNDLLADGSPGPFETTRLEELKAKLQAAILRLGEPDREIIILCDQENLPHRDVADILGIRAETVTVKLYRARRKLARILGIKEDFL